MREANEPIWRESEARKANTPIIQKMPTAAYRLFADVVVGAHEQTHEDRDGSLFDDDACVVARAARDVGQRPGRLELKSGIVVALKELDELGNNAGVDDVLNRRVPF